MSPGFEQRKNDDRRDGDDRRTGIERREGVVTNIVHERRDSDRRSGAERRDGGERRGLKDEMLKVFEEDALASGPQQNVP